MKNLLLLLTLTSSLLTFGNAASEILKTENSKIAYETCTYTITTITSEGIEEDTYSTETRTKEECEQAAENHRQYLETMAALQQ